MHATVRDPSKEEKLADLKALPGASKRLKFFKGDLLEEGSFMEACKGCSVLFHTASPFFEKCEDSEVQAKLLDPALKGTINALNTANACDSVKRVVLTSSVAAIYDENKKPPYSEADWAVTVSATHMPYYYSKYLAEKKAWEMQKEQSRYGGCSRLQPRPPAVCRPFHPSPGGTWWRSTRATCLALPSALVAMASPSQS